MLALNHAMAPALPKLNIPLLETAITDAKEAGIPEKLVAKAEKKLQQALKRQGVIDGIPSPGSAKETLEPSTVVATSLKTDTPNDEQSPPVLAGSAHALLEPPVPVALPSEPVTDDEADGDEAPPETPKTVKQKKQHQRAMAIEEVLQTERRYVEVLRTIENVYVVPLHMVADQPRGAIFTHADIDQIFKNVLTISKLNQVISPHLCSPSRPALSVPPNPSPAAR